MNKTLEQFARNAIKDGLSHLDENNSIFFKRMYSPTALDKPIAEVVDAMPVDKLDWALTQVENSLNKRSKAMM